MLLCRVWGADEQTLCSLGVLPTGRCFQILSGALVQVPRRCAVFQRGHGALEVTLLRSDAVAV